MTTASPPPERKRLRRDMIVAASCGMLAATMIGAAYAAVPLYDWFCRTTGFGGTTMVSEAAPDQILGRTMTIRFDANVMPGLPWRFVPEQNEVKVRIGEVVTINYKVINQAARDVSGQASYNVTPPTAGAYFHKINCFCFTEQRLKAGETREMAVVFYVDPKLAEDAEHKHLHTITLSYSFYLMRERDRPVAGTTDASKSNL